MRDPQVKSYSPAMTAGDPVVSVSVIGRVLKSSAPALPANSLVQMTAVGTTTYSTHDSTVVDRTQILRPPPSVPLTAYLGPLGMTGMTAYGSLHEIGQPQKGETILISAAAGAVGQVVGQIALREGLRVIGSVGDERKLEFITRELGFTGGFNYKSEKEGMEEAVKRLCPDGVDIYFDNVGGELLDVALSQLNTFGRIGKFFSIFSPRPFPGLGSFFFQGCAVLIRPWCSSGVWCDQSV